MTEKIFNRKNFFNSPEPDADVGLKVPENFVTRLIEKNMWVLRGKISI